jgi:transposase InsO family protein
LAAHRHWHIDVSYPNIGGTLYYLSSILDGFSRHIALGHPGVDDRGGHRRSYCRGVKEVYPEARPRIISDNGPEFIAKDFREFMRITGMTHVRTSPFYPQSNGRSSCWPKSLKGGCIRPGTPLSLDDARRLVRVYVDQRQQRPTEQRHGLRVTPKDMWRGGSRRSTRSAPEIGTRKQRRIRRRQAA